MVGRAELMRQGHENRREWPCPFTTGRAPHPGDELKLSPRHREIIEATERLTGAKGLRTCPMYYVKQPHVHEAVRAHYWVEKGALHLRVRQPSHALLDAIEIVEAAQAKSWDRQRERDAEERALQAEHAAIGRKVGMIG